MTSTLDTRLIEALVAGKPLGQPAPWSGGDTTQVEALHRCACTGSDALFHWED